MEKQEADGLLDGEFKYKKNIDGTINKRVVICTHCSKEFQFHRSNSTLKYHLNAKHAFVGAAASPGLPQTTLSERRPLGKSSLDKLTDNIAKWIAKDCRPLSIVEDKGFADVLKVASQDASYKPPARSTITIRIHELYETEKKKKEEALVHTEYVALTGDHWTSLSNDNYLGVTAHLITEAWGLTSFALTIMKTEERHFAEACAEQFQTVARRWRIEEKVTTVGTDSARNMIAAARIMPFNHMPCTAHILQRCITVSLADSGFVTALAKCRKIVGHFKHSPANTAELNAEQVSLGRKQEPLAQDVPTRWNSTLEMVKRLIRNQTATELLGGEAYVSCSVVLPAFCHLRRVMEVTDEDPAYVVRFKEKFKEDLASRQEHTNYAWLQIATALDPRFKDLRSVPKTDREAVWTTLAGMLHEDSPRRSHTAEEGPAKKRLSLLQMDSDSESEEEVQQDRAIQRYRAEPCTALEDCPLQWWAAHAGAHSQLARLARRYLATPASTFCLLN
uniref:zinc finger BED domain-containing protein 1-like n=1 Tax=Maylandia zebra TaxID=106582 RepID=UPI000D30E591|nr:zinc finger BED domain-containing protein 1-like [Maylandia zebra]